MMAHKGRNTKDEIRRPARYALCAMRYAQSVLESTLAYAAVMAILGATMGIFGWGIGLIPARQATYEATRIIAATPSNRNVSENGAQQTTTMAVWPTFLAGGGIASAF